VLWQAADGAQSNAHEITEEDFDDAFWLNARGTLFTVRRPELSTMRSISYRVKRFRCGAIQLECVRGKQAVLPPTHGCGWSELRDRKSG